MKYRPLFPCLFVLFLVMGCGGKDKPAIPDCKPIFMAAQEPSSYTQFDDEIILLFPPPGSTLAATESLAISGRAFGDFSGGIEVNGAPATVLGNAFHAVLPGPGDEGVEISIIARDSDGQTAATLDESFKMGLETGVALSWHIFSPPHDPTPFFQLLEEACTDRLIFLMLHEKTPVQEFQNAIKDKGLHILGYLGKARVVVADKETILSLTTDFMENASILWLGPMVPEMKYHLDFFDDLLDVDLGNLKIGESIAGVPAVTFGGSDATQSDVNVLTSLLEQHSVWQTPMSDTFARAVLELENVKRILQNPLIQWVEKVNPACPECLECVCDMSACATAAVLCPTLFGDDAFCENEACWLPE